MSQISPPIRILLVGAVVLAAAWVLVLKPKNDTAAPAPTPIAASTPAGTARNPNGPAAATGLGRAVQKAEGASQTSDQTNAKIDAASGGDETTSAPSTSVPATQSTPATSDATATKPSTTTAKPATAAGEKTAGLPAWVDSALGHKTVAILFWNKSASDDRRTHEAFANAFAPKDAVVARSVPISDIAAYGKVARGVDVAQSPTLMIIDENKDATALVGYENLDAINQAIIDARLAKSDPATDTEVGRQMAKACSTYRSTATISSGDLTPVKDYKADLAGVSAGLGQTLKAAPKAKAGPLAAEAGVLRKLVKSEQGVVRKIKAGALKGSTVDTTQIRKAQASNDTFENKASLQLNAIGVTGCQ